MEAGPRGSPKTEFCKITPPVRSGEPHRAPPTQNPPKLCPQGGSEGLERALQNKIPSGPPFREAPNRPKSERVGPYQLPGPAKLVFSPVPRPIQPKSAPEGSKTRQNQPREPEHRPKSAPGGPKSAEIQPGRPRTSQNPPREAPHRQKSNPGDQKSAKIRPGRPKSAEIRPGKRRRVCSGIKPPAPHAPHFFKVRDLGDASGPAPAPRKN